jgi:hypothetical protein
VKPFPLRALKAWNDGRFAPHVSAFGGSPSGNTNTIQNTQPWAGQSPYFTGSTGFGSANLGNGSVTGTEGGPGGGIYGAATALYQNAAPQYYPSDTYAPLTDQQRGLMSNLINYAGGGGSSGLGAANENVTSTLSPQYTAQTGGTFNGANNVLNTELQSSYLDPRNSPAYETAMSNAMAQAAPAASASFVNGNRSDSGLATAAETSALANAAGGLAQTQYNTNQGIQQNAAQQAATNLLTQQGNQTKDTLTAPMIDQATNAELTTALNTSGMSQTDLQNQLNANVAAYNYGQMLPWNQLGLYESAITGTGSPGSSTQTSQPYFNNTAANVASLGVGALAGGAALNSLFPSFFPAVDFVKAARLIDTVCVLSVQVPAAISRT